MLKEVIKPGRGTSLKQNGVKSLKISIKTDNLTNIFLINGENFITNNLTQADLIIKPNQYYMLINRKDDFIRLKYSYDISDHKIIYNPYKYETLEKIPLNPQEFILHHNVPKGYIDILSKWYSIKFTYPNYNLIYIKPEMGISIQIHKNRSETWEILGGNPIVINGNRIFYFVNKGEKFQNRIMSYHSIINPNKEQNNYVIIKEEWKGIFDEKDIKRIYNPNNYQ
jgi:mannose-6-phosphate isomerase-like protein (cupin superfamily)